MKFWVKQNYVKNVKEKTLYSKFILIIHHLVLHPLILTFSGDDRDSVATLQLPLISNRQGEFVRADLKTRHGGNSAVCILNLHTVRTPGGAADGHRRRACNGMTVNKNSVNGMLAICVVHKRFICATDFVCCQW